MRRTSHIGDDRMSMPCRVRLLSPLQSQVSEQQAIARRPAVPQVALPVTPLQWSPQQIKNPSFTDVTHVPFETPESGVERTVTIRLPRVIDELINTLHLPKVVTDPPAWLEQVIRLPGGDVVHTSYSKAVMNSRQKITYFLLVGIWGCALLFFWSWWLRPEHIVTIAGMIVNSLVLLWSTLLPAYYFFFMARMHQPDPALPLPDGRVAMVVTKAPSEPWSVVEKTLTAMKAQRFPRSFDVWLADEDPSEEVFQWCITHGIWISCRKDMPGYHNSTWPRRQKCKEGNLSYFYDTCGYRMYDFVVQLDADHVPEPDYLFHMIAPFRNPAVGYVAAPSICDANASSSWPARARLYREAGLHGATQAGYSFGFAPLCIGSHYAVRTSALKEVGGLGPELAEDHSTSFLFNAHGWRGAFALNAVAHGDGAECLADSVTQEFQWSRSLTKLLLTLMPRYWKYLPLRLKAQFLFCQLWYSLSCINMLVICLLPLSALVTQIPLVDVNYFEFLAYFMGTTVTCLLVVSWIKRQGWFRPADAKVLSWETALFPFVCWPWTLLGVVHAIVSTLLKKELSFHVTPKGRAQVKPLPGRVLLPYTLIVILTFDCSLFFHGGRAYEYHWLATINIAFYTIVVWASVVGHIFDNRAYGMRQILSAIKGSFWQLIWVSACMVFDQLVHFSAIVNLFPTR